MKYHKMQQSKFGLPVTATNATSGFYAWDCIYVCVRMFVCMDSIRISMYAYVYICICLFIILCVYVNDVCRAMDV